MERKNQPITPESVSAWMPVVRNLIVTALGLAIGIQQTFFAAEAQPYLLAFAGTLLGIPFLFKLQDALKE